MEPIRDAIYYQQLARVARAKASRCGDRYLALRLREAAIRHDRMARTLRRAEKDQNADRRRLRLLDRVAAWLRGN